MALLSTGLERGQVFERDHIPPDVVTLDCKVRLRDADSGRSHVTTVTLPWARNDNCNAPLLRHFPKMALLGARVGDDIVWRSAGQLRRARIEEVLSRPVASASGKQSQSLPAPGFRAPHDRRERFTVDESAVGLPERPFAAPSRKAAARPSLRLRENLTSNEGKSN